jgi:CDP-glycerol glycerophosphotransferase
LLPTGSDDGDRAVLDLLHDYLAGFDPDVVAPDRLRQLQWFFLCRGDAQGVASVADYLLRDRMLATDLVSRDGRVYWCDRHLDDDEVCAESDVTDLGFHQLSLPRLPIHSYLRTLAASGRTVSISGSTRNQLGQLPTGGSELALTFTALGSRRRVTVPISSVSEVDGRLDWSAQLSPWSTLRPKLTREREWQVGLRVRVGKENNHAPVTAGPEQVGQRVLLAARRQLALADGFAVSTGVRSHALRLRAVPTRRGARMLAAMLAGLMATRAGARVGARLRGEWQRAGKLARSGALKSQIYRHVLVRLPARRRSVVFDSHLSRSYSDSPRYIYEEIRRRGLRYDCVWTHRGDESGFPTDARLVRRGTWRYYLAFARAAFWVDNQGLPPGLTKPARTTYVQTWHGSALKRMGKDTPGFRRMSAEAQARHRRAVARWDYFLARSEHDVRTLVRALDVKGEVLRSGYPRNDLLAASRDDDARDKVRAELGLALDATIVLYAPTFRETYRTGRQPFELRIDLGRFAEKLPGSLLLVRTHYLERPDLPPAAHAVARDVSHLPDITPLMAAADVLVTDYSSVMFDFAATGRPMVFFTFDYDDYVNSERGVYFDLASKAPGPLAYDGDQLIEALATVEDWRPRYADRYREFLAEFCEYDQGDAAAQVVDRVFAGPR